MPTISIGGNDYPVYVTVADATVTLTPDLQYGDLWTGTAVTTQERAIVTATYWLDRKSYTQDFTHDTAPQAVIDANAWLAVLLVETPTLAADSNTGSSNIEEATSASGAGVRFFSPQPGAPFPDRVQEILGTLLASSSTSTSVPLGAWDGSGCREYSLTTSVCC